MRRLTRALFRLCLLVSWPSLALAGTLFQDGFESSLLGPEWSVSASYNGRYAVSTNYAPAAGEWHLVLDDSVSDALYSVAEATLRLDLTNKKNVVLSFKSKSLGNEPDFPLFGFPGTARNFDAVSISTDGGATWQVVQSLATVGLEWETFSIPLDLYGPVWGKGFGADFRIRFSEYDN